MTQLAVTVYVSDWCPYCQRAKSLLTQKQLVFNEVNIEDDVKSREEMMARSNRRRSRIEVGIAMPGDLAASYFTTTVVPTGTRL